MLEAGAFYTQLELTLTPELFIQLELTLTYYLITKGEMLGGGLLNAYEAPGSKELGAIVIA